MDDININGSQELVQTSKTADKPSGSEQFDIDSLFFGSYNHTVDGKGRIIIPSAFRSKLGKNFAIAPTRDLKSIALYPHSEFAKISKEFFMQDMSDPDINKYIRGFTEFCFPNQQADQQGRLLIPPKFRRLILNTEKDVVSVGELSYVRISKQEVAEKFTDDIIANADEYAINYNKKKKI